MGPHGSDRPAWAGDIAVRVGSPYRAVLLAGALIVGLVIGVALVMFGGGDDELTGSPPEPLSAAEGLPVADADNGEAGDGGDDGGDGGVAAADTSSSTVGTAPVRSTIVIAETAPPPSSTTSSSTSTSVSTTVTTSTTATTVTTTASTVPADTAAPTTPSTSTTVAPQPSSTSTQTSTTVAPTRPSPGGDDAAAQQSILALTNAERAKAGCPALTLNSQLNAAADAHSEDMAARDYFDHDDPEGRGPGDRIAASGYKPRTWGENIAAGYRSAEAVVEGWMNSAGHRRNILNCDFAELGVGYATNPATDNWPYWTQVFGTQR